MYEIILIFGSFIVNNIFKIQMNPQKKIPNKNQLLEWLNSMLKTFGYNYYKIEQMGTGVAYLNLLNCIHPGILNGLKYNKKPNNQYEYQFNLKVLANAFTKLGIDKIVEIQKLSKLKMQDNLLMLQWFYNYYITYQGGQRSRGTSVEQKKSTEVSQKKMKRKMPDKFYASFVDKTAKMQIQEQEDMDIRRIGSAKRKINQIQQIIHSDNGPNEIKLEKIAQILNIGNKKNTFLPSMTPIRNGKIIDSKIFQKNNEEQEEALYLHNQNERDDNVTHENLSLSKLGQLEKKELVYIKPRRLEQKYEEYLKSGILKSNISKSKSKDKRQSVRLSSTNQVFEYQPISSLNHKPKQNDKILQHSQQNTSLRQTDNSILLHSDQKSATSETNLLHDM